MHQNQKAARNGSESKRITLSSGILISFLLLCQTGSVAQTPDLEWSRFEGHRFMSDAYGVTVDGEANAVVTGRISYSTSDGRQMALPIYTPTGTKTFGPLTGCPSLQGLAVSLDSNENICVAGYSNFFVFDNNDPKVAKFDPAGALLWERSATGPGSDQAGDLAVDGNDNIYIVGNYTDALTFDAVGVSGSGAFAAKYAPNGDIIWAKQIADSGLAESVSMGNASFFVVGNFASGTLVRESLSITQAGTYVVELDLNGDLVSTVRIGDANLVPSDLMVEPAESFLVAGGFQADSLVGNSVPLTNGGAFLARFDSAGNVFWAVQSGGGTDSFRRIDRDTEGNTYATGKFLPAAKYSPDGRLLWTKSKTQLGLLPSDPPTLGSWSSGDIAAVSNDIVYLVGTYRSDFLGGLFTGKLVPSPGRILDITPQFNGEVAVMVGALTDHEIILEASNNGSSWSAISTNQAPVGGIYSVVDAHSGPGRRFYRAYDVTTGMHSDASPATNLPPAVTTQPSNKVLLSGTPTFLQIAANGPAPLRYQWYLDGEILAGATNPLLQFATPQPANSGLYHAVAYNTHGFARSLTAKLTVKNLAAKVGGNFVGDPIYTLLEPITVTLHSVFDNGTIFYTLDGSAPSFASTRFTTPIAIGNSTLLRAIAYSADFSQSHEMEPIQFQAQSFSTLSVYSTRGGTVSVDPPAGPYSTAASVTIQANPSAGWTFLHWLGDAGGTNNPVVLPMTFDRSIKAVFGTTLSTTTVGGGTIAMWPDTGIHPYGTIVRLTAIPQAGNYFGFWGNAAIGNYNPLFFTVTNPTPVVSSIFGATPEGHVTLVALVNGQGNVEASPAANSHPTNTMVTLTAVPSAGQKFLNWSGDASGSQNPLNLTLTSNVTVTANFTSMSWLHATSPGFEGMTPNGFRMTLTSVPPSQHDILGTTNFDSWEYLGTVTNKFGEVQFTDPEVASEAQKFYRASP